MHTLTPAERRGAMVVALLLALGAVHDLWRASRPAPPALPGEATTWIGHAGPPVAPAGSTDTAGEERAGAALDLNRATAHELDRLPGIGPVLAGRIVAHRERHGPFGSVEELLAVRGIGPRLFGRLKPRVMVAPPPAPARTDSVSRDR